MKTLVLVLALTLTGLHPATAADPARLQAATSVNAIGTELLASRLRSEGPRNLMVSPVSLFYALSVLALGADGASRDLLHARLLADADAALEAVAPALSALLTHDDGHSNAAAFGLANSLWSTNGETNGQPFVFAEAFAAAAEHLYGAHRQSLDFQAPGAARVINDWANEQTRGLVPAIVDDRLLAALEWAILNAALFEGSWGTPMRRIGAGHDYRFVGLDGVAHAAETIVTTDYVSRVTDLDDGSVAFQLPFLGGRYAFVAHLPAGDEPDLASWLVDAAVPGMPDVVARVLDRQGSLNQLSIRLPVFAFSDSVTMRRGSDTTRDLGLAPLFGGSADLSRMVDRQRTPPANQDTRVGLIKQDTRIELDEKGIRAAAVTLIGGVRKATVAPRYPHREIVADRPFAFAIVETRSQTLLFNGVLAAP